MGLGLTEVVDADLSELICYPGFASLDLAYTAISDGGLVHVGEMQALESLRLEDTQITSDGIAHLANLTRLERLNIGSSWDIRRGRPAKSSSFRRPMKIDNDALSHLVGMSNLHELLLTRTHVDDVGLTTWLPELPHLQKLDLACLDVGDIGIGTLHGLSWLRFVNLMHTNISHRGIVDLVNEAQQSLTAIHLSNTVASDSSVEAFPEDSRIRRLSLRDTAVTDAGLALMSRLNELKFLGVQQTDISDNGVRHLEDCEQLRSLYLSHTSITDDSLIWLAGTKIERLALEGTQISDIGMPTLCDYSDLENLDLSGTKITDRGLRYLGDCSGLKWLRLTDTEITNAGLAALRNLPLEYLDVNITVNDEGLANIARLTSLEWLTLDEIDAEDLECLTALDRLEHLTLYEVPACSLEPLGQLQHLKALHFNNGDVPAPAIARLRLALPNCQVTASRCEMTPGWDYDSPAGR